MQWDLDTNIAIHIERICSLGWDEKIIDELFFVKTQGGEEKIRKFP